jgi:hypothetical protein
MQKMPGQKRKGGSCEKQAQKFDAEKRKEGYGKKELHYYRISAIIEL